MIDGIVAVADAIAMRRRSSKRIMISFDEWNVWYREPDYAAEAPPRTWTEAPRLIEDTYNVTDAVVVGGLLISLLRHADRVGVACLAQLVNVIAPIRSEPGGPAWRQTTFHPFALTARYARGEVLRLEIDADRHETAQHGEVDVADAVATWDADAGELTIFAVNRSDTDSLALRVDTSAFPAFEVVEAVQMHDADRLAVNDAEAPDRVRPVPLGAVDVDPQGVTIDLEAVSWAMVRLRAMA